MLLSMSVKPGRISAFVAIYTLHLTFPQVQNDVTQSDKCGDYGKAMTSVGHSVFRLAD